MGQPSQKDGASIYYDSRGYAAGQRDHQHLVMTHSGQTKVCGTHLAELREHGVTVLRGVFANHVLAHLKRPAEECFSAIDGGHADRYGFTPFSHSVTLAALLDFGLGSVQELLAPF